MAGGKEESVKGTQEGPFRVQSPAVPQGHSLTAARLRHRRQISAKSRNLPQLVEKPNGFFDKLSIIAAQRLLYHESEAGMV